LTLGEAQEILSQLKNQNVCEILMLSGEVHPDSVRREPWFERIYDLCLLALEMGFLPHTNVGPLSWTEMQKLKSVNFSMGLMLEQLTPKLLNTVHRLVMHRVNCQKCRIAKNPLDNGFTFRNRGNRRRLVGNLSSYF
jgi:2-iminoacetate synthase ThiH